MKIHRLLIATAGLALGLAILPLRPAAGAPAKPAAETPHHPLFLWKVMGGKGTVYLLGSIHAAKADFYPLPRPIERDFAKSSVLVEEINLSRQDPARLRRLMLEKGLYPAGDNLANHISAETRRALQKYLKRTGQKLAAFLPMKPWLVTILISGSTIETGGISSRYGIDVHFAKEAQAAHKEIKGLESARFQLDLLSNLPPALQEAMLLSSLDDAQKGKREVEALLHAWRTGNGRAIEDFITEDERKHPRLKPVYEELLPERNRRMVKKIEAYLATPKTWFVVVGVGHLLGRQGIVALLRDKKYTVERISAQ
jgi:uncharacterized protein YbaP (TraB family)